MYVSTFFLTTIAFHKILKSSERKIWINKHAFSLEDWKKNYYFIQYYANMLQTFKQKCMISMFSIVIFIFLDRWLKKLQSPKKLLTNLNVLHSSVAFDSANRFIRGTSLPDTRPWFATNNSEVLESISEQRKWRVHRLKPVGIAANTRKTPRSSFNAASYSR